MPLLLVTASLLRPRPRHASAEGAASTLTLPIKATRSVCYGRTLSVASMLYFADVFLYFFYGRLSWPNGQTKLSRVVDIRCYLRTY